MFKFATTVEAIDFKEYATKLDKTNSPFVDTKQMDEYIKSLYVPADEAVVRFNRQEDGFLVDFVKAILPIWVNKVVHDTPVGIVSSQPVNSFRAVFNSRRYAHSPLASSWKAKYFTDAVQTLLVDAYELDVSEKEFNLWVERLETWMLYTGEYCYFSTTIWRAEYDIGVMSKFKANKWENTRSKALGLIVNQGHTPELVASYGIGAATLCSPEELAHVATVAAPKTVKDVVAMAGVCGRETLTYPLLLGIVNAGFVSGKEIKDYARKFGVAWSDALFFTRLTKAKTLYPDLDSYQPAV